ncbi:MAG: amidohydrolase [Phenylobacterium sp.]|nr:amidohydrolase [Phenylobacterium sp.]
MDRVVLTNATLIDVDQGARPGATITLAGERIEEVSFGAAAARRPEATVIDLQGCSVLPGLFNCHYHASYMGVGGGSPLPVGMEASPGLQTLRAARHLELALEAGFTGVVSAGAPHAIDAALKAAVEEGTIRGPRMMAGSRDVSTTGHSQDLYFPWHWEPGQPPSINCCDGPDEFRRGVRNEIKRGAEIIKIFLTTGHGVAGAPSEMELTREELAAAIDAAHQRGAKVRAHIANRGAILTSVELGIDVVDHGDGLDEACIARMLEKNTFLVPSMLYPYRVSQMRGGPIAEAMKAGMDEMAKMLPVANKAGLKIVLGDDFGAVPLNHGDYADELDFYVNMVGIAPLDVLRWATRNGAELMNRGHELGAVKPGYLADLIVVDGDPLADIKVLQRKDKLLAVLKGGRFEKNTLGALKTRARPELTVA